MIKGRGTYNPNVGFSLVEILVVIGIIMLLAGFVLSAVAHARERGAQTTCTSNLRQIGMAVAMYMHDCDEKRPLRFSSIVEAGQVKSPAILLCPDDPTNNWGGIYADKLRQKNEPPDSVPYSYLHVFSFDDGLWERLSAREGSNLGIVSCQLHGNQTHAVPAPSILNYEGLLLRLNLDGAVVRRYTKWKQVGNGFLAESWQFFLDAPMN